MGSGLITHNGGLVMSKKANVVFLHPPGSSVQRWYPPLKRRTEVSSKCEECGVGIDNSHVSCVDCCEHEFDTEEGCMCLYCGKDGMEDVMADAFDRAKAARNGGDY